MLIDKILSFWFGPLKLKLPNPLSNLTPIDHSKFKLWFGPDFDAQISSEFSSIIREEAVKLEAALPTSVEETMALIILFDQFPRNAFRNTPESFAYDSKALLLAKHLRQHKWDVGMNPIYRGFAYLPFEHSEKSEDQDESLALYKELKEETMTAGDKITEFYSGFCSQFLDYAVKHRDLIVKFGRYPHRNLVLGRESTAEELEYLNGGGETFGVSKQN